jgi:hypothetical protein
LTRGKSAQTNWKEAEGRLGVGGIRMVYWLSEAPLLYNLYGDGTSVERGGCIDGSIRKGVAVVRTKVGQLIFLFPS